MEPRWVTRARGGLADGRVIVRGWIHRVRPVAGGAGRIVAMVAIGVAAGVAALAFQPEVRGDLGPGSVTLRTGIGGDTTVEVPPLGRVLAPTHSGPIGVTVRIDRVDVDRAGDVASAADPAGELRSRIEADIAPLLRRLAGQTLVVAALAGFVLGLAAPGRSPLRVGVSTAGAVGAVLVVGGLAWTSFDPSAFDEPRYEGPIAAAPELVANVSRHVESIEDVEGRLEQLSIRTARLYQDLNSAPEDLGVDSVTILHVSDLHSNPVGIELAQQVSENFAVDAVLDTGDLTSFGADPEGELGPMLRQFDVPYLLVPGNHDHPRISERLGNEPNVTVLDGQIATVRGITILGVAQPVFTADNRISRASWEGAIADQAVRVERLARVTSPDVVAVHDVAQADQAFGMAPVVASGHFHRPLIEYRAGSVLVQAGTAGAHGLEALLVERDFSYQLALLRFVDGRLTAVDRLEFRGVDGAFRLERILIDSTRISAYPDRGDPVEGPLDPLIEAAREATRDDLAPKGRPDQG